MTFIMIYHFLPDRMKIGKVEQFVANLQDKAKYVIHIRNLKQALNYGLFSKKVYRLIKINQNTWLKQYIDMNTCPRKKQKMIF